MARRSFSGSLKPPEDEEDNARKDPPGPVDDELPRDEPKARQSGEEEHAHPEPVGEARLLVGWCMHVVSRHGPTSPADGDGSLDTRRSWVVGRSAMFRFEGDSSPRCIVGTDQRLVGLPAHSGPVPAQLVWRHRRQTGVYLHGEVSE